MTKRSRRRTRLTAKERNKAKEIREEWEALAGSTTPADRASAERGVKILYTEAGFDQPEIAWETSPGAAFQDGSRTSGLARYLTGFMGSFSGGDGHQFSLKRRVDEAVDRAVDEDLLEEIFAVISDPIDERFRQVVETPVVAAAKLHLPPRRWANCHSHWIPICRWNTIGGPSVGLALEPTAGWIAANELFEALGVIESPIITGYSLLRRSSPWWWPSDEAVLLLERPRTIRSDRDGNIHAASGKAITYRDRWGLHVRHGEVLDNPRRRAWKYPMGGSIRRGTTVVSPIDGIRL